MAGRAKPSLEHLAVDGSGRQSQQLTSSRWLGMSGSTNNPQYHLSHKTRPCAQISVAKAPRRWPGYHEAATKESEMPT